MSGTCNRKRAHGRDAREFLVGLALVVVTAAAAAPACRSNHGAPNTNGGPAGGPATAPLTPPPPPPIRFAKVAHILDSVCARQCHDGRPEMADDIVLSDDGRLYQRLMDVPPSTAPKPCQGRSLVVPGDPAKSLMLAMVEEPDEPRAKCAERMPDGCPERRPCLDAEEIHTIRLWIESGAPP